MGVKCVSATTEPKKLWSSEMGRRPRCSEFYTMDDDFEKKSSTFMQWLVSSGAVVNPKISLVDLRNEGKNRGVGEFSIAFMNSGKQSNQLTSCYWPNCPR